MNMYISGRGKHLTNAITRAEIIIRLLRGEIIIASGFGRAEAWKPFYDLVREGFIDYHTQHKGGWIKNQYFWRGKILKLKDPWDKRDLIYEVYLNDEK